MTQPNPHRTNDPFPWVHRASGERAATGYNGWMGWSPRPGYDAEATPLASAIPHIAEREEA